MIDVMDAVKTGSMFIGGPVYLYFVIRWMTIAIVRSYFETKADIEQNFKAKFNKGGLNERKGQEKFVQAGDETEA